MHLPTSDEVRPAVLVVDDVEANLLAIEAVLEGMPCEPVRATSGNDALRLLLKREFAVLLLDVQMPEMDGYEVARLARENPATREVPIIFLTAINRSDENALRGYGTGAVDFLLKPINPHILRSKVQIFAELWQSKRRLADEVDAHRRTLAELELANAALRHFTSAASHDLREPLRAIQGFLGAIVEDGGERLEPGIRDSVERGRHAAGRMVGLLDSLLAYARLGKPIAWEEVDCNAVVEHVKADLAERIAATRAVVSAGPLPTVRADRARIYQLFLNLVGNALKFQRAGEPPRVTIGAREGVFCVEDRGIGIPAAQQKVIFEAFRRLHGRGKFEGTGLGLTICQQIVEQHGGRIWVESEPQQGSRFYFTLG
jgi:two-component system sensor histidine kinase/response regulator